MFSSLVSPLVLFLHSSAAPVVSIAQPHSTGSGTIHSAHADDDCGAPVGTISTNGSTTP